MQFNSSSSYNIMETNVFNVPTNTTAISSTIMDGISSQAANSLVRPDAFDLNFQNGIMSGYPVISALHEEPSGFGLFNSDVLVSRSLPLGRNSVVDALLVNSRPNSEIEFQDHFAEGTPISAAALATLLATRNCFQENVNNLPVSSPSVFPSQVFRSYASNDCANTSHSSFDNTLNTGYESVVGDMNSRWDFEKFFALPELSGKPPERTGFPPFRLVGNMDSNGWISSNNVNVTADHPYSSSNFSNELSLSLATSQPSVVCGTAITDQCSDISSSGVTRHCLTETGIGSEQTSSNSRELSLSFGSYRPAHFSQVISRSRYLHVVQDILAEIASYSLENLDQRSYSTSGIGAGANIPYFPSCFADRGISATGSDEFTNEDSSEVQTEPVWRRREIESKKTQLLALLQVVDDRYNQCLDEIHTVISAFHAATELNPQMHARFALHTMSFLYKNLRERISNQILAMGANHRSGCTKEKEGSTFDTSFIQKQWALQQLRRKEHQLWRPQRGLPERSVSVLRAWMFQNFLHPYPKDAEKHLLAVKSGLTRSQVSNWFINARVRLWKPMIEEMYSEMNRRKGRRNDEESENNGRSGHINMDSQRFKHN